MVHDLSMLANHGIRSMQPYRPGKPVGELQRELGLTQIIKLASNESAFGASPKALDGARAALAQPYRYPDGSGFELKRRLAEFHNVSPDRVTLGNGSNDVLELIARVFVAPSHEVMYSQHAFIVYSLITQAIGAGSMQVPATEYGHDLAAMAAATSANCRLVYIANPNNPTGTWNGSRSIRRFLDTVPDHIIVVIDEAYCDYVDNSEYPNCIPWLENYPNLVVTRTFSKAYGLAALRIGYTLSSPMIADLMNRIRQPFNVNSVALGAALAALDDNEHIARARSLNHDGMQQLEIGLSKLGMRWIPSVGNFICVQAPALMSGSQLFAALLRRGVIVRTIDEYELVDHVRVTIGTGDQNEYFLSALAAVLLDHNRPR